MVTSKVVDNRWIKRYKICFIVGIIILFLQLYIAISFISLNIDNTKGDVKNNHIILNAVGNDVENSVNYGRKSKDGIIFDDEDIGNSENAHRRQAKQKIKSVNGDNVRLRLEELDFTPPCKITSKEAISAIHRAKTQNCKQKISNITCLIQNNLLYPKLLPNFCSNKKFSSGKALGCFKDEKEFRLLSGYYGKLSNNSPEKCIRLCLQSGFPFAGVQYSTECFCGDVEPPSTAKLPDSSCNMKCPSDPHLACGGYYAINIYHTGITKFLPQIAATSSTDENKDVKIVFLLTLNGRALRQVKRLIKILFHKNHYFYIHVDVRQDYLFRELLYLEKEFPNIRLTRNRFATIWGGASLLDMLLSSMKELLHMDWTWDFVLNLSESDYPVKTVNRLVEFLGANKGKNFVKSHGREVQRFIQRQGLDKTFVECDMRMWRTGDRLLPSGIQIDGGSDWIALSRTFVQYVANDKLDELVKGLLIVYKHTLLAAESFFHTVLRNSKFCDTYVDNNLHVTNWKRKLGCKCQYKHIVDWCGCSPNDFKLDDWQRIQNTESRQLFFARKFEPIISQAIILQLELWLYNLETARHVVNMNSYWQSLYHHLDISPIPDDSLITVCESAIRYKTKVLSTELCAIKSSKLLEIHSYHVNDTYHSTLLLFEVNITNAGVVKFETALKPKNNLNLVKSSNIAQRIKMLVVSSDYDQKEQVARNFHGILGPYSEPTLIYIFNSDIESSAKFHNLTFLWIDSSGKLADVYDVSIDDNYVVGHYKLTLKAPLLPGAWKVELIHKSQIIAKVKFLITPLQYLSRSVISQSQVEYVHAGTNTYKDFDSQWDKFIPTSHERQSMEQLAISNSKRFDQDLKEWIDTLFMKFFNVGHVCIANNVSEICGIYIQSCHETSWSTFAYDPKSTFDRINETTGSFNLW